MSESSQQQNDIGTVVGSHYKLVELIDQGGQAFIYRATDARGGPDVAVKVLRENFASDPDFRERLARECQILYSLQAPAALKTFGFYWTSDERPCLVTELLRGRSLGEHLEILKNRGSRLSLPSILACMGPISLALHEAHQAGVVHRDLKPDNIFVLDGDDWPVPAKLLDFGFAKFTRLKSFTAQGTVAGSPRYIAPEGWLGVRELTPAFDVYSFAAVVFTCLTGEPPYPDKRLHVLLKQVTCEPRPQLTLVRPDLTEVLDQWFYKSLAIDPQKRFASLPEQFSALEAAFA